MRAVHGDLQQINKGIRPYLGKDKKRSINKIIVPSTLVLI